MRKGLENGREGSGHEPRLNQEVAVERGAVGPPASLLTSMDHFFTCKMGCYLGSLTILVTFAKSAGWSDPT